MIVHALPGRIRLRHAAPQSAAARDQLEELIHRVVPAATIRYNPQTLSTLILFQDQKLSGQLLACLAVAGEIAAAPKMTAPLGRAGNRKGHPGPAAWRPEWPSMYRIKRGMVISLAASLGLLALRRESGHAMMGGLFLGLLGRHLWVYRRNF